MSTRTDYFGTFLDTLNRPRPEELVNRVRELEDRNQMLAQEKGQLLADNRRLQEEKAELSRQNERLTGLLELALKEKGIGTRLSTVA
jgi:hypothetical protein